MNATVKNLLSWLLRLGLSGALLWYLFRKIDVASIGALLKSADYRFVAAAGGIFFITNLLIFGRWLIFVRALGLKLAFRDLLAYFFIGLFFNLLLPSSTGGDLVKTLGLCRYTDDKAKVVASVVLDRLSGFAGIVLIALISYLFGFRLINDVSLLVSILLLGGLVSGILTVLFNETLYGWCCRIFDRLPKVKNALLSLHRDLALLKNKTRVFGQAVLLSCFSQAILALTFYLIALALHAPIKYVYFLIFVPLLCVVSSLPSIGGLGVRDAGAVYLFGKVGMASATAVSVSLMNFFFMVAIGLIGGVISVPYLSAGRVQRHQTASAAGRAAA